MEPLTQDQFCERFKAYMVKHAGFERFKDEDGNDDCTVAEYAEEIALSYWHEPDQRTEGPEECAAADMSYWGE